MTIISKIFLLCPPAFIYWGFLSVVAAEYGDLSWKGALVGQVSGFHRPRALSVLRASRSSSIRLQILVAMPAPRSCCSPPACLMALPKDEIAFSFSQPPPPTTHGHRPSVGLRAAVDLPLPVRMLQSWEHLVAGAVCEILVLLS